MRPLTLLLLACDGGGDPPPVVPDPPDPAVCATVGPAPGMRRLTRFEYDRATSDLLGEAVTFGADLPVEVGSWEGLAASQAISPLLVDGWWRAAASLGERFAAAGRTRLELEDLNLRTGEPTTLAGHPGDWWTVTVSAGSTSLPIPLPPLTPGRYRFTTHASWTTGFAKGNPPPTVTWRVAGVDSEAVPLAGTYDAPMDLVHELTLDGEIGVELIVSRREDDFAGVALDAVRIEGPLGGEPGPGRWSACALEASDLDGCARRVLTHLADRAWRRPPTEEEVAGLLDLVALAVDEGDAVEVGVALAARAALLSPHFLLRVEEPADAPRFATPAELASRLSFTLWASIPDDELRACADAGELTPDGAGPCGLDAQVTRMLAHPRADALVHDLGRQWLGVEQAATLSRDAARYPQMSPALGASLRDSAYGVLQLARAEDADLRELVDGGWTWADAEIARLYGAAPPAAPGRIDLPPDRRGLLGSAFFLAVTSHPDQSSPVLRGKWILDRLLCDPPDTPPPGIPQLPESASSGGVREALAAHRADPGCAVCHDRIDPLGLPLEGYDALGQGRDRYEDGSTVETTSEVDGAPIDGLADLAAHLAADPAVPACVVRHAATWAWDRLPTPADAALLAAVQEEAEASGFTLDGLARALVMADPLRCVSAGEAP